MGGEVHLDIYDDRIVVTSPGGMYSGQQLTLKNNIVMRNVRQKDYAMGQIGDETWSQLDDLEQQILVYMASNAVVSRAELEDYTNRSNRTITTRLNRMLDMGIIKAHGSSHDPKRSYSMVYRESSK